MDSTNIIKVFFPHCLLNARSGICIGSKDSTTQSICVLAIIHTDGNDHGVNEFINQKQTHCKINLSVIGTYTNESLNSAGRVESQQGVVIEMKQRHHNGIPFCRVVTHPWREHHHGDSEISPLLILYDEVQMMRACGKRTDGQKILHVGDSGAPQTSVCDASSQNSSQAILKSPDSCYPCRELDFVMPVVHEFSESSFSAASYTEEVPVSSIRIVPAGEVATIFRKVGEMCVTIPAFIAAIPYLCLHCVSRIRWEYELTIFDLFFYYDRDIWFVLVQFDFKAHWFNF